MAYYKLPPTKEVAKKLIACCALLESMSACSGLAVSEIGESNLLIHGSAESIRAFGDWQNGTITNSKAPSEAVDTPYYSLRRMQVLKPKQAQRVGK